MSITIKEIAALAGVHRSTVDKVIHNRIGVSEEVRLHIQKIIDEYAYSPNPLGKALKRQEEKIVIGVSMIHVDALEKLEAGIRRGLSMYAGFTISLDYSISEYTDPSAQIAHIYHLIKKKVAGIILCPLNTSGVNTAIDDAVAAGIPVITLNGDIGDSRLCFIGQNTEKAGRISARLMAEFLNKKGNLGIITSTIDVAGAYGVRSREHGFESLLAEEFPNMHIVARFEGNENHALIYSETIKLLQNNPTLVGLYITCGGVEEVGKAIVHLGLQQKIKVLCFENYPEIIHLIKENVVTCSIGSELDEQGYRSIRVMLDLLIYDRKPEAKFLFTKSPVLLKENADD